jgi:dipeptidyl aminopeptidase/acylaminoacyl peptidase
MRNRIVAVSLFFVAAFTYASNETVLIPRRVLFANPDRGSIRLSPDGTRIAFVAAGQLWIAPITDATRRERITADYDGPVASYEWAFTGNQVLYRKQDRLVSFDLESRRGRDLGALQIVKLSPRIPNEVLVATASEHPDLLRVNIATGESKPVLQNPAYEQFYVDLDFVPRVAIREAADGGYELSSRSADGAWRVLFTIPIAATIVSRPIGVDGDGKVVYVVDNQNRDKAALKAIDLRTGRQSILVADDVADLAPAVMVDPRSGRAESATASYARTRRHFLNAALRKDFDFLGTVARGDIGIAGRSADDRVWLVVFSNGGPGRYYAYDRAAHRATFLTTEYDGLEPYPLGRREAVEFTTRDGLRLPGDLYWPSWVTNTKNARLPMVIVVDGGPSAAYPWNSWTTNRMLQLLANRGYVAFRVEFRGTGGLGKKIMNAGDREWGRKMNDDLIDAANWAAARGVADRDRVGAMGWSYGGYAAVAALTFTPQAFACGVAMYPVTDLVEIVASRDPFVRSIWREQVGDETTAAGRALLESRSPVHFAEHVTRPLLITHGTKDDNVAPSHSEREVKALEAAHKNVTYLRFTDEGHDYAQPKNLAALFAATEAFLHTHLGGREEPVGSDMEVASLQVATVPG